MAYKAKSKYINSDHEFLTTLQRLEKVKRTELPPALQEHKFKGVYHGMNEYLADRMLAAKNEEKRNLHLDYRTRIEQLVIRIENRIIRSLPVGHWFNFGEYGVGVYIDNWGGRNSVLKVIQWPDDPKDLPRLSERNYN